MLKPAAALGVVLLTACASSTAPILQSRLKDATPDQPVSCGACAVEWQRAQIWLTQHSKWRIATATDVTLVTFQPTDFDVSYGFQVLRIPRSAGGYQISMALVCGNPLGCDPQKDHVRQAFYHYVVTGRDVLTGFDYLGSIR